MNELQLFLQIEGVRRIEVIKLPADATAELLLREARRLGLVVEDVLIFVDGRDEPVALDIVLREIGVGHHHHVHAHRCRHIEVTVHFNATTKKRAFTPHATVAQVKAWFVHAIEMPPLDAGEHVLQLTGTQDRPETDLHLGTLAQHPHCAIDFTLVPKKRVEG